MPHLAFFYDDGEHDGETNLFSAEGDAPHVGDTVSYSMQSTLNKEEWDPEVWEEYQKISRKYWKVINVCREYRKYYSCQPPKEIVYVYVKPVASATS